MIKPNVAFERAAALGATTNPEVLGALIRLVREAGAAEVRVADNPIESPESCFVRSGIHQASLAAGARLYLPAPGDFETLAVEGATWIGQWPFFARPFQGATKVIGVAPVKDHNLCRASMTTKNWYGLLGGRRNQFHQDIHGIIADLALMLRPTFVLLDGTRVLFRSGPTGGSLGDVRPGRTVAASTDTLAVDAFGWDDLLQRQGEDLRPTSPSPPPAASATPTGGASRARSRGRMSTASRLPMFRPNRDGSPWYARAFRITTTRIVAQGFFFALFSFLLWATWFSRLEGYPVSLFLELDPLVGFATALSTHTVYRWLWRGLIVLAATLLFGRVFCNWICPYGTLHQFTGWLFNILTNKQNIDRNRYRSSVSSSTCCSPRCW